MLCGDNFQKPPPNTSGTAWYKTLVRSALPENERRAKDQLANTGENTASARGRRLLKMARLFPLTKLMRAREDEDFIDAQLRMRETGSERPIPAEFVNNMKVLSKRDFETDSAWIFAPCGALSHVEGETINYMQAEAY